MSKKREIFRLLDRDCVSPISREAIKEYIDKLIENNQKKKGEM